MLRQLPWFVQRQFDEQRDQHAGHAECRHGVAPAIMLGDVAADDRYDHHSQWGTDRIGGHRRRASLSGEILRDQRSEEQTSELQSLMRITYAVFRLKKKK